MNRIPIITTTSTTVARQIRKSNEEKHSFYQDNPGFEPTSSSPEKNI